MNSVEEKLWSYIDGTCTDAEKLHISQLIETNEVYRSMYQDMLAFNQEMQQIELEEPSMPFTYNVMEAIRQEEALKPLKASIDSRIIKGITAFFILTISVVLIYAMSSVNWSAGGHMALPINIKLPSFKSYLSGQAMQSFLFFDVILALYLLDGYFRKQRNAKNV
ncbi:hypothetical protein [Mucilaginibacter lacusdianchii]|uniref:hypothetical protein n=1 Tax=Mucilaginibacter lacusdianchii TaxID=2684211 RepID=UPI00131AB0BA|nr:hypothetical protein [Mucilaginibacter sp. JXJ CY 39]